MGRFGNVAVKCFIRFLLAKGCVPRPGKGSHEIYKCPKCTRSVVVRPAIKNISESHIRNNLNSMGCTVEDFLSFIASDC